MTFHPRTIVATAVLATVGVAQQRSTEANERHDKRQSSRQESAGEAQQHEQGRVLAVRLLDHEIRVRGDREPEIEDLVYDPSRRTIAYALVTNDEHGGYNGVPLDELEIRRRSGEDGELVIRANGSDLDDWPMLDEDDWGRAATMRFADEVAAERKQSERGDSMRATSSDDEPRRDRATSGTTWSDDPDNPGSSQRRRERTPGGRLVLVSDLMDQEVLSESNDEIGDIENLAVDANTGRVPFVVVGTGGFLGMGETVRAIPVDKLRVVGQGDERRVVADISSDEIEELPKFTRDRVQRVHADDVDSQLQERSSERDGERAGDDRPRQSADENDWIVTVWEVYSAPVVPVGAAPRIETEPARLPLELPSHQTTFTVEVDVKHDLANRRDPQWRRNESERPDVDERSDEGRRDETRGRDREGQRRGAIYVLSPAERQRDGAHKIDVSVTWYGAWDRGGRGADDDAGSVAKESGDDRRIGFAEEASASQRSRGRTTAATATTATPNGSKRHFTVTLERDGSISEIDTRRDARGRDWRLRKEAQDDARVPMHADRVRSHLELILGAGLHSRQLQPGSAYACSSQEQGAMDFCLQFDGCVFEADGHDSVSSRQQTSDSSERPMPSTGSNDALRGKPRTASDSGSRSRDGLARFSVLSHGDHDRERGDAESSRWNGAALFDVDDGMIEDLHAHHTEGTRTCIVDIARHSIGLDRREAGRRKSAETGTSPRKSERTEQAESAGRSGRQSGQSGQSGQSSQSGQSGKSGQSDRR